MNHLEEIHVAFSSDNNVCTMPPACLKTYKITAQENQLKPTMRPTLGLSSMSGGPAKALNETCTVNHSKLYVLNRMR